MSKQCQTEFAEQRKALLENSLLELLQHKTFNDITVSDICKVAEIPRRTFYHYFENKDDVLESVIDNMMVPCYLNFMVDLKLEPEELKKCFAQIFQFWQGENRRTLDVLMKNSMEHRLMAHALKWVRAERIGFLQSQKLAPKILEIGLMVGVTDFFSLLFYWSRNGYQESPMQMAEYAIWVLPQAFYTL